MKEFSLLNSFGECPKHWRNLIKSLQTDIYTDVPVDMINKALRDYHGKYVFGCHYREQDRILFETAEDYLAFILRWS